MKHFLIFGIACIALIGSSLSPYFFDYSSPRLLTVSNTLPLFPLVEEKPFVVVIASYNNEAVCKRNLKSVFEQNYSNYRVIYIDDCSTDRTYEIVKSYIEECGKQEIVTLIRNETRQLKTPNLYKAYHSCKNHEIIICLDGDDWLAHNEVFKKVNRHYQNPDVWITHGSCLVYPKMDRTAGAPLPKISSLSLRNQGVFEISMLRTFYAGLFKQIKLKDFFFHNKMMANAEDAMIMFSLIELAPTHVQFIPDILYIINDHNPFRNYKVALSLESFHFNRIQEMKPYDPLPSSFSPLSEMPFKTPATVVLLSNDTPLKAKEALGNLATEMTTPILLYHANSDKTQQEYVALKTPFPHLRLHNMKTSPKEAIQALLNSKDPYHIIVEDTAYSLDLPIAKAVQALCKTKTPAFFSSLSVKPLFYENLFDSMGGMSAQEAKRLSESHCNFPFSVVESSLLVKALSSSSSKKIGLIPTLISLLEEDEIVLFDTNI